MILAFISITLIYLVVIGRFILGFDKIKDFELTDSESNTSFSIVIPFRNEAENLPNLLESLSQLNYPETLYEIILVNDESTDESVEIITKHIANSQNTITLINSIRNTGSPKKDAINTAINASKKDWILTSDADCTFNEKWLITFDTCIQEKQPKMVIGPVTYTINNSFLERFQLLDFMSLVGATIGGFGINKPFLCNGANLAYSKVAFKNVNGFDGNDHIASGDDIFLMEKMIQKYPDDLMYLKQKEAIVTTKPQNSVSRLISQRKRWAAKTSSYSNSFGKLVGSVVLLMNFSLIAAAFFSLFGVFSFKMIGYVFLIKFSVDLLLIFKTAQFFNKTKHLSAYTISSLLYPFFNVYIAISSWYSGYTWKGRSFKK